MLNVALNLTKSLLFVHDTHSIACCSNSCNQSQWLSTEPVSGSTLPNTDVTPTQIHCLLWSVAVLFRQPAKQHSFRMYFRNIDPNIEGQVTSEYAATFTDIFYSLILD